MPATGRESPVENPFPDFIGISICMYNQIAVHILKVGFCICFGFNIHPGHFLHTCSLLSELLYHKTALNHGQVST